MKIEKLEYYSSSKDGYIWERHPNIEDITDKINEIIDKLNERNNAEPVRHGKWMYKEYKMSNGENFGYYVCSECNHATWNHKDYHYCFNCGAKMDEED